MNPLKVSQVSSYISNLIKRESLLSNIIIEGEVSNLSISGGNIFFNLKDDFASMRCIVFKNYINEELYNLKDGQNILATGSVSVYEKGSCYQLIVRKVENSGEGKLFLDYLKLKRKLESEGIFDNKYKKKIKEIPSNIALITSLNGAALRDILKIIKRRFPICNIYLFPASVQGINAVGEIIKGIDFFENNDDLDIDFILISRGGGSFEDLNQFNNEILVKRVFKSKIPIISAVGHHTDTTLIDYVSDKFAATPSEAAELIVPDIFDLSKDLNIYIEKIEKLVLSKIENESMQMDYIEKELKFYNPLSKLESIEQELDKSYEKILNLLQINLIKNEGVLENLSSKLDGFDNKRILDRGYGIIKNDKGLVTDVSEVEIGMKLNIILRNGEILSKVESKEKLDEN